MILQIFLEIFKPLVEIFDVMKIFFGVSNLGVFGSPQVSDAFGGCNEPQKSHEKNPFGKDHNFLHTVGDKLINPIVGVYIPIIRIPIEGGMTIPNLGKTWRCFFLTTSLEKRHQENR